MAYDIAMRKLCPLITALFFAFPALAAERVTATGKIVDATNAPIANATVMVYSAGAKERAWICSAQPAMWTAANAPLRLPRGTSRFLD